jgi:hypothetical protein
VSALLSYVDVDRLLVWVDKRPEPIPLRAAPARPVPPDMVARCDGCGLVLPCWFGPQGALNCVACKGAA